MNETVGVLISYYDEKDMLQECVDSVLQQTTPVDEIIIYDDASAYPAEKCLPGNCPVKIIRGETNQGLGFSRNRLLEASESTYVHFQDSDDILQKEWCSEIRKKITETNADIIFTEIEEIDESGKRIQWGTLAEANIEKYQDIIIFAIHNVVIPLMVTVRRNISIQIGGVQSRDVLPQAEDFEFHIKYLSRTSRYAVIHEKLAIKRVRQNSQGMRDFVETSSSIIKAMHLLSSAIPLCYHDELAERVAQCASHIMHSKDLKYSHGDRYQRAKWGFSVSRRLGKAKFLYRKSGIFALLAIALGGYYAERIALIYHKIFPKIIRQRIENFLAHKR